MAIVSKSGSITYSDNEQGNRAHSASDGKFVGENGGSNSTQEETTSFGKARSRNELKGLSVDETLEVAVEAGMIDANIIQSVPEDKKQILAERLKEKLFQDFMGDRKPIEEMTDEEMDLEVRQIKSRLQNVIDYSNFEIRNKQTACAVWRAIEELQEKYPLKHVQKFVIDEKTKFVVEQGENGVSVYGTGGYNTVYTMSYQIKEIGLARELLENPELAKAYHEQMGLGLKSGKIKRFSPEIGQGIENLYSAVIRHEYGHSFAIDNLLLKRPRKRSFIGGDFNDLMSEIRQKTYDLVYKNNLLEEGKSVEDYESAYSETNDGEWFAEMFSVMDAEEVKNPLAQSLKEVLKEYEN